MYLDNLFGMVRSRGAERHFLSRWLSSGKCAGEVQQPRTVAPGHDKNNSRLRGRPADLEAVRTDGYDDNTQGAR